MTFSDSANCESLCSMQEEMGCCYLKTGVGCYWKPGGHSGSVSTGSAIAVTCRMGYIGSGKNQILCFKNQPWHLAWGSVYHQTISSELLDCDNVRTDGECEAWTAKGFCDVTHVPFMEQNCKESCAHCKQSKLKLLHKDIPYSCWTIYLFFMRNQC